MSFIKQLNRTNILTSIAAILVGSFFSYFSIQDYLDLKSIKENGKEVSVKVVSKSYVNKIHSMDILFEERQYSVQGFGQMYSEGEVISLVYSKEKDKFLDGYKEGHYAYVFLFLGIIIMGIATLFMQLFEAWKAVSKPSNK